MPDGVEEALGVALAGELAGLLRSAGILPPSGPVPPSGRLSMLAMAALTLREDPPGLWLASSKVLRSSKVLSSEDIFWSLTVTNGSCRTGKPLVVSGHVAHPRSVVTVSRPIGGGVLAGLSTGRRPGQIFTVVCAFALLAEWSVTARNRCFAASRGLAAA